MCSHELKNIPISTSLLHDQEYRFLVSYNKPRELRRSSSERNQSEKITNVYDAIQTSLFIKLANLPSANTQRARLATVV